jgi:phosphoenolpyruvate carboxykinase (ATP)
MIDAMLSGALDNVELKQDAVFGLGTPVHIPGVPDDVLEPRATWADGSAYDAQAAKLAAMFKENFEKFEGEVGDDVRAARPR